MKTIQVYDPPLCCSTGVCGPTISPVLPRMAGVLAHLKEGGVTVERHNLAQQPLAFAQNTAVKAILEKDGPDALPLIFIDGTLVCQGHYPDKETTARWLADLPSSANP